MTHTPGPWTPHHLKEGSGAVIMAGKTAVALVIFSGEVHANASLIAAAPDMLDALREALPLFDEDTTISAKIEAAIRKATEG